ncbi:unnamed protein product [Linum trigynum]|uniref:Uncharacterized protein n=1 Tax=Linum trigynum TaxID=586398 RepID=A0AAV2DEY8_9ROSI
MPDKVDWRTTIKEYLNNGTVLDDLKESWALRQKAAMCTQIGQELFINDRTLGYTLSASVHKNLNQW